MKSESKKSNICLADVDATWLNLPSVLTITSTKIPGPNVPGGWKYFRTENGVITSKARGRPWGHGNKASVGADNTGRSEVFFGVCYSDFVTCNQSRVIFFTPVHSAGDENVDFDVLTNLHDHNLGPNYNQ